MIGLKDIDYILETVERKITDPPRINRLAHNKWNLASAMQKSIRRGDADRAVTFAGNLWHIDRRMLYRRLEIITLEDIGIGDAGAVAEVLAVAVSPDFRRKVGDLNAALYCARRMAETEKSRSTTHAYFLAEIGSVCREARDRFPGLDDKELTDITLDRTQPPGDRSLALWFIAGTDRYPSGRLYRKEGNLDPAMEIMAQMNCPFSIAQTCILHLKRSRYPLALLTALLFDLYGDQDYEIIENDPPDTGSVNGLPFYALDQYTRSGKEAVRQWHKKSKELKRYSPQQVIETVFHVEGGILDRERLNDPLRELKRLSITANLLVAGVREEQQGELMQTVMDGLPELNAIRARIISEEKQNDLFG